MRNIKEVFINGVNLEEILDKHEKWLKHEKGGEKAKLDNVDLSYVDLSGVNLFEVDLYNANLTGANLSDTDLSYTNLSYANLRKANLNYTNLKYANLSNANLNNANLIQSDLTSADLTDSNLSNANLKYANLVRGNLRDAILYYADLSHANLEKGDLSNVDLEYANLMSANLKDAILNNVKYNECTSFLALQCPEEGSFIGYKKAEGKIVKLLITEDAKRSNATTRKCRCSKAKVLSITNIDNTKEYEEAHSYFNYSFIYKVGEIVEVKDFDENRWEECSTGIHVFLTRDEAVNY